MGSASSCRWHRNPVTREAGRWRCTECKHLDQCSALINYPLTLTFLSLSVAVTQQGQFLPSQPPGHPPWCYRFWFFTFMFWHECQKTASPRAMTASDTVPCPATARCCQTLQHLEGRSGHPCWRALCSPRGPPRVPGTTLPGVGPRGWGCCSELSHLDNLSGGGVHTPRSSYASVSSCARGCPHSHASPARAHPRLSFCAGCTVSCSPAGLRLGSCLRFCLQGATLLSPASEACPSPKPGLTRYLWLC